MRQSFGLPLDLRVRGVSRTSSCEMGKQCGLLRHILQPVLQHFAERAAARLNHLGVIDPSLQSSAQQIDVQSFKSRKCIWDARQVPKCKNSPIQKTDVREVLSCVRK